MFAQAEPRSSAVELALDATRLRVGDHVGVFYRGTDERDGIAIPLIGEALAARCGVIYVCDEDTLEPVRKRLLTEAIDVDAATAKGQLRIVTSTDAYLPDGTFEPDRTVMFYRSAWEESCGHGYPVICVVGEMSWRLRECPGTERFLEYEALYAVHFGDAAAITLCLYDVEQTRGEQIFDLLRLHGRVVLNGIEMRNPCRMEPGTLLSRPGTSR